MPVSGLPAWLPAVVAVLVHALAEDGTICSTAMARLDRQARYGAQPPSIINAAAASPARRGLESHDPTPTAIPCISCVVDSDSVGSKVRSAPWGETEYAHLLTLWTCRVHAKVTHWRIRLLVTRTHPIAVLAPQSGDFAQVWAFGVLRSREFQMGIKACCC